jgi:tetratricopeptide (TPR) repeat protein
MRTFLIIVSIVSAQVVGAGAVRAAGAPPSHAASEAKGQYDQGLAAYERGEYQQAVDCFTRAYDLDPAPILLFNIAQSHWKQGDGAAALRFYRRYLEADPGGAERARAEARIRELEAARAPAEAPSLPSPPSSPPDPPRLAPRPPPSVALAVPAPAPAEPPYYRRPWVWGVAGGVVAAAVLALVLRSSGGGSAWSCADCNWATQRLPP